MFLLVSMEDIVYIPPVDLGDQLRAIKFAVGKKYANKVCAHKPHINDTLFPIVMRNG